MIYFFVFILSYLLIRIGEQDKQNGRFFYTFLILSVVILSLFGGLRDDTVGADTSAYPVEVFEFAQGDHTFEEYLLFSILIEPLYVLLCYVTTHFICNDFHVWLTVCQAVIIVPLFIGAVRMRKFIPVSAFIFFFCLLFYHSTLNIQRQWMAVSIIFLGFTYLLLDNRLKTFVILSIIAFFIHRSSFFSIIFIPIFYFEKNVYNRWLVIGSIVLLLAFNTVLSGVSSILNMDKYDQYASGGDWESSFSISEFLIRVVLLFMILSFRKKNRDDLMYYNVLTILLIEFVLNLLQIWSRYMGRLGVYAFILYIPFLSYYIETSAEKNRKRLYYTIWVFMSIGYWLLVYIEKNAGYTIPYKSEVLGL